MTDRHIRFGPFRLDLETGDLIDEGGPVAIQPLPARVLALLASRPGALVERETLKHEIWGRSTFSVDQALNTSIRQVRRALGDDAGDPRYIATVPRRGYRFVAEVAVVAEPATSPDADSREATAAGRAEPGPADAGPAPMPVVPLRSPRAARPWWVPAAGLAVLAGVIAGVDLLADGRSAPRAAQGVETGAESLPGPLRIEYLKARHLLAEPDEAAWRRAAEGFDAVRGRQPGFLPAVSGAAHAALRLGDMEEAAGLAAWTIAADPASGEAHMVLGITLLMRGELPESRQELEEALRLDPSLVGTYTGLATLESLAGHPDRALRLAERSLEVDPLSALTVGDAGFVAYWSGRHALAIEWCTHATELDPGATAPRYCLVDARHALGDEEAERQAVLELLELIAPPDVTARVAALPAGEALVAYRQWQIERIDPERTRPASMAIYLASLHAQNRDFDTALELLGAAADSLPQNLIFALPDPVYDPVREDERFRRLAAVVGEGEA